MEPVVFVSMATFQSHNISFFSSTPSPGESNSTEWDLVHAIVPPYIFFLCVTGILGNTFVLLVYLLQRSHWNVPEIYLGNLALADLLLLACLPVWAMYILNHYQWEYGQFLCKTVNASIIMNMYTSIYLLVMVNVDRYLALVQTMRARWLRRTRYAKAICVTLWLFGLCMGAPTISHRTVKYIPSYQVTACVLDYSDTWRAAHNLLLNLVGFALPLLVIVFCSCNIVRALNKRRKNVYMQGRDDRKATVLVCAVTLLFLICWGPFQVLTFLEILYYYQLLDRKSWEHILDIGTQFSTYFAFANSSLNPVLYVFTGQYFKRKISKIYKRRKQSTGSAMTGLQRSVVSTYLQKTDQIKPVVL